VQGNVTDTERYSTGLAVQMPLHGDEIKDNVADLPEPFDTALSWSSLSFASATSTPGVGSPLLSANCWCCAPWPPWATLPHSSAHTGAPAYNRVSQRPPWWPPVVHCFPYIGFPRAGAAIRAVKDL